MWAGAAGVVAVPEVSDGLVKVGKTACSCGWVCQREGVLGLVPMGVLIPFMTYSDEYKYYGGV